MATQRSAAPFGALLGMAPGGVPAYSSDYATADEAELPDRHAYRSYVDGIYMGHKWQCVEFARRWLYENRGWVFDDVGMAYEIFDLRSIRDVRNHVRLPMRAFRNGARRRPEPGCLLVWDEGGEFEHTGHVAIVVEVTPDAVRFAEQNLDHRPWPEGQTWSREIRATRSPTGEFWLESSFADATILGWVIQTDDDTEAEPLEEVDPDLLTLVRREVDPGQRGERAWLNVANPDEAAFVEYMEGHYLSDLPKSQHLYFLASTTAREELERATNQLHALFMHATDYVLRDDALLERFCIPRALWPKIHQSWNNRRNQMITGRFDFAMTREGLKVYEYNCDSAACYMECGKVQGKWAAHYEVEAGEDAGEHLHDRLRDAWRRSGVDGLLHILQDEDPEETYHALFMQEAMERAGIESRVIRGTAGLTWADDGGILDPQGDRIRWVWKSWAWETALDQIRSECEDDPRRLESYRPGERHDGPVRLVDVLLRGEVMVFEPLWTLVPSNKAILPVLWSLFPNHPYLLATSFQLDDELRTRGWVSKPIVGRCGGNIRVFGRDAALVEETAGRFGDRDLVHQELFPLARVGEHYVQPSSFSVGGVYAAAAARVEESLVITGESNNVALRFVDDEYFRELLRAR
ncbi:MAG TPA: bifunctional glutathionylspermidine amidase/synthase [Myxococcota bacterium]|nr:bifunctional glutathionylspermidine amidase/synthase [Myxococcota bacterium]